MPAGPAREDEQAADVGDAVLHAPEVAVGGDRPALDGGVGVALGDDAVDAGDLADAAHAVRDHPARGLRVLEGDDVAAAHLGRG